MAQARKKPEKNRMTESELLSRIVVNPAVFGGKPTIRGLRMAVEHVLAMLAAGDTPDKLLQEYPFLEAADIQACLAYAHRSVAGEQVHQRIHASSAP
jgi:uncharacterized protein (DUF433 family)